MITNSNSTASLAANDKFRISRSDQSPYLFHYTKGTEEEAKNTLFSILSQKKLISRSRDSICFTASPITSLKSFFKTMSNSTGLPMYQPFGIGFARDTMIYEYGARNVIYGTKSEIDQLPKETLWRAEELRVYSRDFEYLREWRIKGKVFDFSSFPPDQILVVAPTDCDVNDLVAGHEYDLKETDYGDVDCEEVFPRQYKGLSFYKVNATCSDDNQVKAIVDRQELGGDMFQDILQGMRLIR